MTFIVRVSTSINFKTVMVVLNPQICGEPDTNQGLYRNTI